MTQTSVAMLPANLNVLSVASEMYPLIKTGGLGDVVGSLPGALRPYGIKTHTLLPGYPSVMEALEERRIIKNFENVLGYSVTLWEGVTKDRALLLLMYQLCIIVRVIHMAAQQGRTGQIMVYAMLF